ncbi:T9SS type A sorting domain-containing protein [Flavobacterium sp.]|uniref:T9SS type A sorting domain-containing protein n=1 Tax=Flavobacterium sp. TaxID=239 RepID=UPI00286CAA63|nr:T9SS type A sorting domain-containing protein [Flavobacterium sp.]
MKKLVKYLLVLCFSTHLLGQNLVVDPTFGTNGIASAIFPSGYSQLTSMQMQPDGKIVVCGHTNDDVGHLVGIARINADGSLDQDFGTDGKIILNQDLIPTDKAYVRITQDNKILVVSTSRLNLTSYDHFLVAQYNEDGTPDTDFGNNGIVLLEGTGYNYGMELQNDGKIIIIGDYYAADAGQEDFVVVRLDASGNFDETFGDHGKTIINFGTYDAPDFPSTDIAFYCKILNDGSLLIGGTTITSSNLEDFKFAITKLDNAGKVDLLFGNQGKVITPFSGNAMINTMMVNDNDEIFALGSIYTNGPQGSKIALAKYDANGNPDVNFGTDGNGTVITQINFIQKTGYLMDAFLTDNGKILGTGLNQLVDFYDADSILMQYNQDGTLDSDFANNGMRVFDFSTNYEGMFAILPSPDDKILIGGLLNDNFCVIRLQYAALSTVNNTQTNFSIFPNPTKNVLNIVKNQSIDAITITDVSGKKVIEVRTNTNQVDVSKLQQGIYFMQIQSQGKITTQKFIKE